MCRVELGSRSDGMYSVKHGSRNGLNRDCLHAAKVDWALTQETGCALDVLAENCVILAEWPGPFWLSRAENRHRWDPKQGCQMHCPRVVGQQQVAIAQMVDELFDGGFAREIRRIAIDAICDLIAESPHRPSEFVS